MKSKLSGSWQLVSVDPQPLPAPDPDAGAQPAPGAGDLRAVPLAEQVRRRPLQGHHALRGRRGEHRDEDRPPGAGGRAAGRPQSTGIHWHVDPEHALRYRSDEKRADDLRGRADARRTARRTRCDGPAAASTPEAAKATEWRTMDCVDCHNRPTHIYRTPGTRSTPRSSTGRIDPALPFIRREGLKALAGRRTRRHEAARPGIAKAIAGFYAQSYPQVAAEKRRRGRRRRPRARRHLVLERLPDDEHQLGDLPEPPRPPGHEHGGGLLPLPRRRAQDRRRARRSPRTAARATRCSPRTRRTRRS